MKYKIFLLIFVFLFAVSCSKISNEPAQNKVGEKTESTQNIKNEELAKKEEEIEKKKEELEKQEEELKEKEMELEAKKREAKLEAEIERLKQEKKRLEEERKRTEREKKEIKVSSDRGKKKVEKEKVEKKKPKVFVVPEGTELIVSLMERLSTAENERGNKFRAVLDKSIKLKNGYKIPVKTVVEGKIVECVPSGKVSGRAKMAIRLTKIRIRGKWYEIRTNRIRMVAKKTTKKDAAIIGGSSALGAIIGGIVGGKKGAGIGALIAGGTGTAVVLNTKGKEIVLPVETEFKFELRDDLVIKK